MSVRGFAVSMLLAVIVSGDVEARSNTIYVPGDYATIAEAITAAYPGDRIVAESSYFSNEPSIDWLSKSVRVESLGSIYQPSGGAYWLGNGATVAAAPQSSMEINGELCSPVYGGGNVECYELRVGYAGRLVVRNGTTMHISAHNADVDGNVNIERNASLTAAVASGYSFYSNASITMAENAVLNVTGGLDVQRLSAERGTSLSAGYEIEVDESLIINGGVVTTPGNFTVSNYGYTTLYESELTAAIECSNQGDMIVWGGMILTTYLKNWDNLDLLDTTVSAVTFHNGNYSEIHGYGLWVTDMTNEGDLWIMDDTTIIGDVENTGEITIYNGSLTILGELDNSNGTIVGNVRGGDKRGDDQRTIRIGGDFRAWGDARMYLSGLGWELRVDGDYSIATWDNQFYDLSQATLTLGSLAGADVECEVMSRDIGPSPMGLDRTYPGHFPLGTLHIAGAVVSLVDVLDNDWMGDEFAEAVYVDTLQIDAGATLHNGGYRVYFNTLINNGLVSVPENLVQIGSGIPGDLDGDGDVDLTDLAGLLGSYGLCQGDELFNPAADFDISGCVDISDLAVLLGNYGG